MTKRVTITIPEAEIEDARTAIDDSRVNGWLRGIFNNAPVYTEDIEDPGEIDIDGNFTGTVHGRIIRVLLDDHVFLYAKQALTAAGITYNVSESDDPSLMTEEDSADGQLGNWGQRRPGRKYKSFGTFKASGTKASQSVNTSGKKIDQWNNIIRIRNMTTESQQAVIGVAGDYELRLKKLLWDTTLAPGVTWTFQAVVNNVGTGATKLSSNGSITGNVTLSGLSINDKIAVGVAPDSNSQEFKVLDALVQLARV